MALTKVRMSADGNIKARSACTTRRSRGSGDWYPDSSNYSVASSPGTQDDITGVLGFATNGLRYVVTQNRAKYNQTLPCTISLTQKMEIDCDDGTGGLTWTATGSPYETHTNDYLTIDTETISAQRNTTNGDVAGPVALGPIVATLKWGDDTTFFLTAQLL
jgi:hypothetical protein